MFIHETLVEILLRRYRCDGGIVRSWKAWIEALEDRPWTGVTRYRRRKSNGQMEEESGEAGQQGERMLRWVM